MIPQTVRKARITGFLALPCFFAYSSPKGRSPAPEKAHKSVYRSRSHRSPVNPVSGEYEIGKPKFKKVELQLANGKVFTVLAKNLDKENRYIRAVKLDGKDYHQSFITHEQILSGATLELEMCNEPGHIWY